MRNRANVEHLVWDAWNLDHVRKHDVRPNEVEEVVAGRPLIRETYKQRLQLIGPTRAGRLLSVIVGPVPDEPALYYTFSARPASRKERSRFAEAARGEPSG